jgi:hypothetical protein
MTTMKYGKLDFVVDKPSAPQEGYLAPISTDKGGVAESIQNSLGSNEMKPDVYVPCRLKDGAGNRIGEFLFGAYEQPHEDYTVVPLSRVRGGIDERYYPKVPTPEYDKDSDIAAKDEVCVVIGIVLIVLWVVSLLI